MTISTRRLRGTLLVLALWLSACSAVPPRPPPGQPTFTETGVASWYGRYHHGKTTAAGERFDMNRLTAAHRSLPFNTTVRVTNLENRKTVKVRINDRGPYVRTRIIDLSSRAARELGIDANGVVQVRLEVFPSDQGGAD